MISIFFSLICLLCFVIVELIGAWFYMKGMLLISYRGICAFSKHWTAYGNWDMLCCFCTDDEVEVCSFWATVKCVRITGCSWEQTICLHVCCVINLLFINFSAMLALKMLRCFAWIHWRSDLNIKEHDVKMTSFIMSVLLSELIWTWLLVSAVPLGTTKNLGYLVCSRVLTVFNP